MVENVFGMSASRFRILNRPMDVTSKHAQIIVLAICIASLYMYVDKDTNDIIDPGNWRMFTQGVF